MGKLTRRLASAIFALGLASGAVGSGRAAGLAISPMHVDLTAAEHAGSIALTNQNDAPLRLEIAGFHWSQRADGGAVLVPTENLIVFPQLLTIPPHEGRNIRLALTAPSAEREDAYQISITELPAFTSPASRGVGLTFRMRANLTVFLAPKVERSAGAITDAAVRAGALTFALANSGTVHFVTKDVRVVGIGSDLREVFSQTLGGGDVLSDGKRVYHAALPRKNCAGLRALTIHAKAGDQTLVQTLDVPTGACRP